MQVKNDFLTRALSASLIMTLCAARSLECQHVWANASANNTLSDCLNFGHLSGIVAKSPVFAAALIPLIIAGFVIFCFPAVTLARYCCSGCGGYRRFPAPPGSGLGCCCPERYLPEDFAEYPPEEKNRYYNTMFREPELVEVTIKKGHTVQALKHVRGRIGEVEITKIAAVGLLVVGLIPFLLTLDAAAGMVEEVDIAFTETHFVVAAFLDKNLQNSMNFLRDVRYTAPGEYTDFIPPLNRNGFFDNARAAIEKYRSYITAAEADFVRGSNAFSITIMVLAFLPMLSLLATAIAAIKDYRKVILSVNSFFHFAFIIIFAIISFCCFSATVLLQTICDERTDYIADPKIAGLMTYYVEPKCQQEAYFDPAIRELDVMARLHAANSCRRLRLLCDEKLDQYNIYTNRAYYCPTLKSYLLTSLCTLDEAKDFISNATMKPISPVGCGDVSFCTVEECANLCNETKTKTFASDAVQFSHYANQMQQARDEFYEPLSNCTRLTLETLDGIDNCQSLINQFVKAGAAAFVFVILFCAGLLVIWAGQKRFFKPTETPYRALDECDQESVAWASLSQSRLEESAAVSNAPKNRRKSAYLCRIDERYNQSYNAADHERDVDVVEQKESTQTSLPRYSVITTDPNHAKVTNDESSDRREFTPPQKLSPLSLNLVLDNERQVPQRKLLDDPAPLSVLCNGGAMPPVDDDDSDVPWEPASLEF